MARLRGGGSAAGEWLDHVVDAAKIATFHVAVAICWFRFYDLRSDAWLLLPLGFAAVSSVFFFALVLSDMLRRVARLEAGGTGVTTSSVDPGEKAPVLRSIIVLPNDYGVLCLVMLALAWPTPFTVLYGLLFAANVLFLAAGLARWFREMSRSAVNPTAARHRFGEGGTGVLPLGTTRRPRLRPRSPSRGRDRDQGGQP